MARYGANVKCPFYLYSLGGKIVCEKCNEKDPNVTVNLGNAGARLAFENDVCSERYESCGIYRILNQAYDEGGQKHELK